MFDHAAFRQLATQLRDHADGYEKLSMTSLEAAQWANHGFLPSEASPWLDECFSACGASGWANRYIGVGEAARRRGFGESGRLTNVPCKACAE